MGIFILLGVALAIIVLGGAMLMVYDMRHPRRKTYAVALARRLATSPEDLGLAFVERTFTFADGLDTAGWEIRGRNDAGPTVILTHGWSDSRYGALLWTPLIADHAARIIVFDQRGHGDSPAPISHLGVDGRDDLIDIIRQCEPYPTGLVLYGYSMGAIVSIAAAAKLGARVDGLIADGPYRLPLEPIDGFLRYRKLPAWLFHLPVALCLWAVLGRASNFDMLKLVRDVHCPLLVLHGTADHLCPHDSARAIAEAAPRGTFVSFPDAAHLGLAMSDIDRYVDALRRFFSTLTTPSESTRDESTTTGRPNRSHAAQG